MLIAFHLCWLLPNWEYGPVFGRVVRSLTRGRSQHGIDNWNLQKKERENISSISPFGFSSHSRNNFSPQDRKSTYLVFAFMETSLRYWRGWICCLLLDYEDFKHIFHELSSWIWNFWSTYTYVNDETTTWIVKPPLFGVFHFFTCNVALGTDLEEKCTEIRIKFGRSVKVLTKTRQIYGY